MASTAQQRNTLDQIVKAKESYRLASRSLTWEEKIASIERMRTASKIAKASVNKSK